MTTETPNPAAAGVQAQHTAALDQGRFLIQRCHSCHGAIYFPREVCPIAAAITSVSKRPRVRARCIRSPRCAARPMPVAITTFP